MLIDKLFPTLNYIQVNTVYPKTKYIIIRKTNEYTYVFLDECIHFGNVTSFIRICGFLINEYLIDEIKQINIKCQNSFF